MAVLARGCASMLRTLRLPRGWPSASLPNVPAAVPESAPGATLDATTGRQLLTGRSGVCSVVTGPAMGRGMVPLSVDQGKRF